MRWPVLLLRRPVLLLRITLLLRWPVLLLRIPLLLRITLLLRLGRIGLLRLLRKLWVRHGLIVTHASQIE